MIEPLNTLLVTITCETQSFLLIMNNMAYCAPWFSVQICGEIYTLMEFLKIFCYFPISFLQHQCCLNNVLVFMYHPFIVTPCILYIRIFSTEEQWAVSLPFRPMVLVITGLQTHNQRSGCFICQAQTEHLYLDFRAFTVMNEFCFKENQM